MRIALPCRVAGSFDPPSRWKGISLGTLAKLARSSAKATPSRKSRQSETLEGQPHTGSLTYLSTSSVSRDSQSASVRRSGKFLFHDLNVMASRVRLGVNSPPAAASNQRMSFMMLASSPSVILPFQMAAPASFSGSRRTWLKAMTAPME